MTATASSAVVPIVVDQQRFEARDDYPGYLFVVSATTGALFYIQQVYPQRVVVGHPSPPVRFRSMTASAGGEALDIVNERDERFHVSIRAKERGSQWPARLAWVPSAGVTVRLTIPNPGAHDLRLDPVSVAAGGRLANAMFRITADGAPVEYRGMMARRAPPELDEFVVVAPGASYVTEVALDDDYQLPDHGQITIGFETFNHFSPDEIFLISDLLQITRP